MEKKEKVDLKPVMKRFWFVFNISWTAIYLLWRIFFTIPFGFGVIAVIAGLYLVIVEVIGMFEAMVHYFNMHDVRVHEVPVVPDEKMPDVDVFISTYSESTNLLFKTINGCLNMEYPDKRRVHIYLCDDGRREEMRALAKRTGIHYLDRPNHDGAKAGNLNHALSVTKSAYIVTFDADMIPQRDFLMKTVPYFVNAKLQNDAHKEDKNWKEIKIGFIQTPQSFYNPDLFQFNLFSEGRIPNEQDYFYRDVQVSRNKSNSVIYGGSNTVIAREALEAVGGFYTKSITEDFATGILIQKKKYICYATSEVLASGVSPSDLKSLIQQRNRWARGCITTGRKMHIIFSRDLTLAQKVNYLASIWYWYAPVKRLIYIMAPILFAVFHVMVVKCDLLQVLIFWLPMYLSSNICLKILSRNIRTTKWTNIYETVMFPFMLIPIILESFGISLKKFKVTKKDGESEKMAFWYAFPHIAFLLLDFLGVVICVERTFESGQLYYIVILFWLLLNLYNLTMCVFFILGRKIYRKNERIYIEYPCEMKSSLHTVSCMTKNFSEGGVLIEMQQPVYINENEEVELTIKSERYEAIRKAVVVHVEEIRGKFLYAFTYTDKQEENSKYLNLLYDRVPTLPQNLDESLSSFDDLRLNITNRFKKTYPQNRKLVRVHMNDIFIQDTKEQSYKVVDFNFEYITIQSKETLEKLILKPTNEVALHCSFIKNLAEDAKLYYVENYKEIYRTRYMQIELDDWVSKGWTFIDTYFMNKNKKDPIVDEFSELDLV